MLLVLLVPTDVPQNAANVMMRSNKIHIPVSITKLRNSSLRASMQEFIKHLHKREHACVSLVDAYVSIKCVIVCTCIYDRKENACVYT